MTEHDTAEALLSGDLPVLGTPRLLAWLEAATCAAISDSLPFGQTSVGMRVNVEHRAASAVGAVVTAQATLTHVDGRVLTFEVGANDRQSGSVLGHGEISRVVVDRERVPGRRHEVNAAVPAPAGDDRRRCRSGGVGCQLTWPVSRS